MIEYEDASPQQKAMFDRCVTYAIWENGRVVGMKSCDSTVKKTKNLKSERLEPILRANYPSY